MISQFSGEKNWKRPEPALAAPATCACAFVKDPGSGSVRHRAEMAKRLRRQSDVAVVTPQFGATGKVRNATPVPVVAPSWGPITSAALPLNGQTATSPVSGAVISLLKLARSW